MKLDIKVEMARKKLFINEIIRQKSLNLAHQFVNKPIDFWKNV